MRVADGNPLRCIGKYQLVGVNLGGVVFDIDLYRLPLTGLDLVLGIQWLELLGSIVCDWKAQWLKFSWAGKEHTLYGLGKKDIKPARQGEIMNESRKGQLLFAINVAEQDDTVQHIPEDLCPLIEDNAVVCHANRVAAVSGNRAPDHA